MRGQGCVLRTLEAEKYSQQGKSIARFVNIPLAAERRLRCRWAVGKEKGDKDARRLRQQNTKVGSWKGGCQDEAHRSDLRIGNDGDLKEGGHRTLGWRQILEGFECQLWSLDLF